MKPKISVIIPVYNTELYLAACLDSVLSQTLRELEIILVNDASPDNAMDVIRAYAARDSRVTVLDKPVNEGVGKARNDGIRAASGEFLCFMDSDDFYTDGAVLEKLYTAAKSHAVKVAGGMVTYLQNGTQELQPCRKEAYGLVFEQSGQMRYADYQFDFGYTQYLFDRRMLAENDIFFPPYARFQDPPFFVRAMTAADAYFFLDEPVYCYRQLGSTAKFSLPKTLGMLDGIIDNLRFSREQGLAKLHCLCARRLDNEGSFMAVHNLYGEGRDALLYKLMQANLAVDAPWLTENGFDTPAPFVAEAFRYAVNTAEKYEKLRNKGIFKPVRRILGK